MQINSIEYFNRQATEFLGMMGDKLFWESPKKVYLAKKGFASQYLSLSLPPEQMEQAAFTFEVMMNQFIRRAVMLNVEI